MRTIASLFLCFFLLMSASVFSQEEDQNIKPFLGQVIRKAVLKAEPYASSKTVLQLPVGSQIYSLTDEDTDGYLKVIYIKTNKIGWLQKVSIKKIRNVPLSKSNSFVESGTSGSSIPEVEITNETSMTISLTVGNLTFSLPAHTTKTEAIDAGFQYYTASAPSVIPLSGSHKFDAGARYTWRFFIVTTRK